MVKMCVWFCYCHIVPKEVVSVFKLSIHMLNGCFMVIAQVIV